MFINNNKIGSYMTSAFQFAGIRRIGRMCKPTQWDLAIQLATQESDTMTLEEQSTLANVSFQKLVFWLEVQLEDIIIADVSDIEIDQIIGAADNNFMYCPFEPTDDVLVQLLHAKIQTILGDRITVGDLTLKSSDCMSSYSFNASTPYRLPNATVEYVLDPIYTTPWWFRPTMDTYDISNPEEGEEAFEYPEDALAMIEKQLLEALSADESEAVEKPPAEVVSIASYTKPTLVK